MKNLNNEKVFVFGHPRSGNNFLLASLYINFYYDQDLSGKMLERKRFLNAKGELINHSEWAGLFGGHGVHIPKKIPKNRCIYIKRNVQDTTYSFWRRQRMRIEWRGKSLEEWCEKIFDKPYTNGYKLLGTTMEEAIKKHHETWEELNVYTVEYEELCARPKRVLLSISEHFGLNFNLPIRPIRKKVGWDPGKGIPGIGTQIINKTKNIKEDMLTKEQLIRRKRRERMLKRQARIQNAKDKLKERIKKVVKDLDENPNAYFCKKCGHKHKKGSKIYEKHL